MNPLVTEASTANLRSASTTHDVLDGLMVTSKHLITALEKSDWLDRLLIFAALIFFVLVVLFILKQRLVDRSLRIAFWWTRFIPSFSSEEDKLVESLERGSISLVTSLTASISTAVSATSVLSATLTSATPDTSHLAETNRETPEVLSIDDIMDTASVLGAGARTTDTGSEVIVEAAPEVHLHHDEF